MNENLIVEDNTIYEIDPECLKKKRKCQGETGEKVETENTKKQKMQRRNFNGILSAKKGLPYVTVLFLRLENTGLTSSRIHSHFRLCRYRSRCHSSRE